MLRDWMMMEEEDDGSGGSGRRCRAVADVLSFRLSRCLTRFFDGKEMLECLLRVDSNTGGLSNLGSKRILHEVLKLLSPPWSAQNVIVALESRVSSSWGLDNELCFGRLRDWLVYNSSSKKSCSDDDGSKSISNTLLSVCKRSGGGSSPLLGCALYTHLPTVPYSDPVSALSATATALDSHCDEVVKMVDRKELTLLQNNLDVLSLDSETNQHSILKILHYTLQKQPQLAVLSGCLAAGLTVSQLSLSPMDITPDTPSDDSSSDDDNDDDNTQLPTSQQHHHRASSSVRHHLHTSDRSEYLTLPKLDKLLQSERLAQRQSVVIMRQLTQLAERIGTTSLFAELCASERVYANILSVVLSEACITLSPTTHAAISHLLYFLSLYSLSHFIHYSESHFFLLHLMSLIEV